MALTLILFCYTVPSLLTGVPSSPVSAAQLPGVFTLYMSPTGSDSWDGLTPGTALRTLEKVQTKLKEYKSTIDQNVEVRIQYVSSKPYMYQYVKWTHTSPNYTISFMPSDYNYGEGIHDIAGRPVFDGRGSRQWFFELRSSKGEATNLRFYYLQVQGYTSGAIAFIGDQSHDGRTLWNGYNTVYGCYFYKLGTKNYPSVNDTGIAALDLGNSDHNLIRNNFLKYLENKYPDESHIHGVYLAYSSDYNLIIKNNFSYISGDPIKVRDYSNYNEVFSNSFTRTGRKAFFQDAPQPGECRSWENEFRDNTLSCGYSGEDISVFKYFPAPPEGDNCPALWNWLYTSGNVKYTCP